MDLVRHVSFVDCPGHDILMATMLNGAAVMDGALLLIAANETCPQPQTSEHLAAVEIMRLKDIIILQVGGNTVAFGDPSILGWGLQCRVSDGPGPERFSHGLHGTCRWPSAAPIDPSLCACLPTYPSRPAEQDRPHHGAQRRQPARRHPQVHPGGLATAWLGGVGGMGVRQVQWVAVGQQVRRRSTDRGRGKQRQAHHDTV